ncbi:MAG: GNAT family N-acetyltransferase [Candidatus Sericytochromatia bacterium]|nr:GNAT family N-acetyltransferase [Candidatus Sericytochromatia bacterium]
MIDINLNCVPGPPDAGDAEVVRLDAEHLPAILEFLGAAPLENAALLERLFTDGLPGPSYQEMVGWRNEGGWGGVLHFGGDMVLYAPDLRAVAPLAEFALRRTPLVPRIFGRSEAVALFWAIYSRLRKAVKFDRQQLLYTVTPQDVHGNPEGVIQAATLGQLHEVTALAAAMSVEEIQIDPLKLHRTGYLHLMEQRIREGRCWVVNEGGKIRFQLTLSAIVAQGGQVTGVYTPPDDRGKGYARRGMQDFLRMALATVPALSLFVNDFNSPALRLYESLGFKPNGLFRVIYLED